MSARVIPGSFKLLLGKVYTSLYSRNNLALYYVVNNLGYHLNTPGVNRDSINRIWLVRVNCLWSVRIWENIQVIIPQLFFVQLQGISPYAYIGCYSPKIHGNPIEISRAPHPTSMALSRILSSNFPLPWSNLCLLKWGSPCACLKPSPRTGLECVSRLKAPTTGSLCHSFPFHEVSIMNCLLSNL